MGSPKKSFQQEHTEAWMSVLVDTLVSKGVINSHESNVKRVKGLVQDVLVGAGDSIFINVLHQLKLERRKAVTDRNFLKKNHLTQRGGVEALTVAIQRLDDAIARIQNMME